MADARDRDAVRTLGELVDKLSVVNLKLWAVQDRVNAAAAAGTGTDAETTRALVNLNRERNALMTEIDQCFLSGLEAGTTKVEQRHKF